MARTLELYWDFSSPFAYLGASQAEALAARTGAVLTWRPMLLGAVFKAIGQVDVPLLSWPQPKQRYYAQDIQRWADFWSTPLAWPTRFPMNTVKALRLYLALPDDHRGAFRDATFRAYWAEDRDINDEAVLSDLIVRSAPQGKDGAARAREAIARASSPELKNELFAATQRAIDAGVFGAPTWVVDGKDLFWGQDRLALVERALGGSPR